MSGARPSGVGVKVYRDVLRVVSRLRECGGIVEAVELPEEDFDAIEESYGLGHGGWAMDAEGPRGLRFKIFRVPEEVQRA